MLGSDEGVRVLGGVLGAVLLGNFTSISMVPMILPATT